MNTPQKQQESISDIKRRRTASRNTVLVTVLLFIALVVGSGATNMPNGHLSTRDILWGGLSVLGFGALLWSLFISYKQADERQQLIQLKATAMTFVAVIFALVTAQILHSLKIVALTISVQIIVIGGILLWNGLVKVVERHSNS